MKSVFLALLTSALTISTMATATPDSGRVEIWPTIPFVRGADLCRYKDAYSQTRTEYMEKMVKIATELMKSGAKGKDILPLLEGFNKMYDQNLEMATQGQYLDVTLESTLKAYISGMYRDLRPRVQKVGFLNPDDIRGVINAAANGLRNGYLEPRFFEKLDYIGYGSYALAPDCRGDIQVTVHLIGRNGDERSYLAKGRPHVVMSQVASQIFEDFQRTHFPTTVKVGNKNLMLIGGMNESVDVAPSPSVARQNCETLGARLPNETELEILNSYGDWSGGVSLNDEMWALPSGKVFAPMLRNPSPVRSVSEIDGYEFNYYCVRD